MREYKLVYLNPKLTLTVKQDLAAAEEELNKYAKEGWILQQLVSSGIEGRLTAVMYKENEYY